MKHVTVSGHSIEYTWHGPAKDTAPTLVFLHEGLGCAAMWRDFPRDVATATGCRALVYSRAGYGGSSPVPVAPRPIEYLHDEAQIVLPALLDALDVRRCVLVGHSDGASIALIHAATPSLAARVSAVIVEAPHCFVEDISIESIARIKVTFETTDLRERLARRHGDNVDCAFWGWNGMWLDPAFRSFDIVGMLPSITVPVLAIQGKDDEYGTLRQIDVLAEFCAGPVERVVLGDCGHSPHKDRPEETRRAMVGFLQRENRMDSTATNLAFPLLSR